MENKFYNIPTPFYYYNVDILNQALKAVTDNAGLFNYHVHYALKANANNKILNIIKNAGLGADCVSGNEVKRAVELGFDKNKIVFAGVGKSDKEIEYALQQDIFCFNCESKQELEVIDEIAKSLNKRARIALRINPNVNANTHHYITTGLEENKFGINMWELKSVVELVQSLTSIELIGIHFHIGSQINDLSSFKSLCIRVNEIQEWFENKKIEIKNLNMGGGLGIDYTNPETNPVPDFAAYFAIFKQFLNVKPSQQVHFELGRSIVGNCASLITKVLYIKSGLATNFAILDAGMTDLIRPALYQAYHKIENISAKKGGELINYDVVGPICESSDCFGKAVQLPETKRGDLIAIRSTGAYGEVMVSEYNLREKPAAVYSDEL